MPSEREGQHIAGLDELDDALVAVRRSLQKPNYRRHLTKGLNEDASLSTLRTIRTVERLGEGANVGAVAELLSLDPSTASRSVNDAVQGGFLERAAGTVDRRQTRLNLTPAGRQLLARMDEVRRRLLMEVTADWDPDEVTHLAQRLKLLLAGFDRLEGPS